jgi:1-acyl-sn-glycerol-3-phosphate acyltransferase
MSTHAIMGRKNIEKYNLVYGILRKYVDFWHNHIYYRKVIVYGRENVNYSDHNIFAPNHQNALMDAIAVLCTLKGQPIFLGRADIFRKKSIARLLYFIKMLPVYRIRDGYENLRHNDETFIETLKVMQHRNGLVILPEGNHEGFRKLRQLKKGICRIAFLAEEATNFTLNVKIIPVGLEFSHYWRFRQVLTVVYGKPISVSQYYDLYREDPHKAFAELRDHLSAEMKKLIVHIENTDDYEAIDELRSIINGKYSDNIRFPKLFRDNVLITKVNNLRESDNEEYRHICQESLTVKTLSEKLHLTYRLLSKNRHPMHWLIAASFFLLVSLPVFIIGAALNSIIIELPKIKTKKLKDRMFISSLQYGLSMLVSFILMPIYGALAFIFIKPWWLALIVFLAIPFSGILAWNWMLLAKRVIGGFRIRNLIGMKNSDFNNLKTNYNNLTERVSKLK